MITIKIKTKKDAFGNPCYDVDIYNISCRTMFRVGNKEQLWEQIKQETII
jgi:hypothetical protein